MSSIPAIPLQGPRTIVTWKAQGGYVRLDCPAGVTTAHYRSTLLTVLALVRRHGVATLLVAPDAGAASSLSATDVRWTLERWLPLACAAGLRRAAVVWPTGATARQASAPLTLRMAASLEVALFATGAAAQAWAAAPTGPLSTETSGRA